MRILSVITGWFRKGRPTPSNINPESHMKQFSEEHLEQMRDRLQFLEYCTRHVNTVANGSGFNVNQRQESQHEARFYREAAGAEIFRLKKEIDALESFLDRD
jgi:hypothetical protein